MRHEYDGLFQYGLRNDKLVHIDTVMNGLGCGCICSHCGEQLIAHNNPANRKAKHFQHKSRRACEGAYETIVHLLAKEIISEQGYLIVPDIDYFLSEYAQVYDAPVVQSSEKVTRPKRIHFDKIEMEKSAGEFRPDLKCTISDKTVYIEIAVTHFVDHAKENKIFRDGSPVLEIDLSEEKRVLTKSELANILAMGIDKMKWINNPRIKERLVKKESIARELKEFVAGNKRTLKVYGKKNNIYNCPKEARYFDKREKIVLEDDCYRCNCFVNEMEASHTWRNESMHKSKVIGCIGHVSKEYERLLKSRGIWVKDR